MRLGLYLKEQLMNSELGSTVARELQHAFSALAGWRDVQHDEDGAHTDITATSLTLPQDGRITLETAKNPNFGEEQIRWNARGNGEMGIAAREPNPLQRIIEISNRFVGPDDMTNYVILASRSHPPGVAPVEASVTVLAGHVGGTPVYFVQLGGQKVIVDQDLQVNGVIRERLRATPLGEWEAYVPVWTNVTVGNGTVVAEFTRIGKTVHVEVLLTLGNTSAVTGAVIVSMPSTMVTRGTAHAPARCLFFDTSAGAVYAGHSNIQSNTTIALYNNASPLVNVGALVPFTWATGDQLFLSATYEEA